MNKNDQNPIYQFRILAESQILDMSLIGYLVYSRIQITLLLANMVNFYQAVVRIATPDTVGYMIHTVLTSLQTFILPAIKKLPLKSFVWFYSISLHQFEKFSQF